MSKVIVVGGGAAGMMASYAAGMCGHEVMLLEKNEKLGKKIYITGKGRCNLTNACDMEDYFNNVVSNPKFLYSAFYSLSNDTVMGLMEQFGTPVKTERGDRVFPVSDRASDVTAAMQRAMKSVGVSVRLNTEVSDLVVKADNRISGVRLSDGDTITADAVIVTTGGLSYPSTGSTGDGQKWAEILGHKVTEMRPALVPLTTKETYIPKMQGLSLRNVRLVLKRTNGKVVYDAFGEMMFTHFGITGPLVLSASSKVGKILEKEGNLKGFIDLKPALSTEQLDVRLLREMKEKQNRQYHNLYSGLLPSKMIPVVIDLTGIDSEKKLNAVTKEERMKILSVLKEFPFTVTGTGSFKEAIITQGGISVKDVNPSTMESKKITGLYFAGEVLDLDAYTGGFNLQIAWSTGYLAGISVE